MPRKSHSYPTASRKSARTLAHSSSSALLPDESDIESTAEEIPPVKKTPSAQVDEELKDAARDEGEDEEDDDNEEGDEDAEMLVYCHTRVEPLLT